MTHKKFTSLEFSVVIASFIVAADCVDTNMYWQTKLVFFVIAGLAGDGFRVRRKELSLPAGQKEKF